MGALAGVVGFTALTPLSVKSQREQSVWDFWGITASLYSADCTMVLNTLVDAEIAQLVLAVIMLIIHTTVVPRGHS